MAARKISGESTKAGNAGCSLLITPQLLKVCTRTFPWKSLPPFSLAFQVPTHAGVQATSFVANRSADSADALVKQEFDLVRVYGLALSASDKR